ncbi:MFS transporter [Streptomyces sp. CA-251387]|uniref:MFS transporter n=1 Tax=Streptomyces sp. CA-251387 TaxID=3240064 RepID=UPI003D8B37C9
MPALFTGRARRGPSFQRGTGPLFTSVGVCAVGSGMTNPLLVVYLHTVRGLPIAVATSVVTVAAVVSLVGNPLGGYLADRIGRRHAGLAGMLVAAAGTGMMATVTATWQALVWMGVFGFGQSVMWPAMNALLGGLVPDEKLPRAFSTQYVVLQAGYGMGGFLAAILADPAHPGSFTALYLSDAASFLLSGALLMRVPASDQYKSHEPAQPAQRTRFALGMIFRDRSFARLWLLNAVLTATAFSQLNSGFPAYATTEAHVPPRVISLAYLANTLTVVVAQFPLARLLRKRSHRCALRALCCVLAAPSALVLLGGNFSGTTTAVLFITAAAVIAVGESLHAATVPALVNHHSPAHLRGQYNGALTLAYTTGILTGPLLAGIMLSHHHPTSWLLAMTAASLACLALTKGALLTPHAAPASKTPLPAA